MIHRGNAASGGTETSWTVSRFLEIFGEHPQGNALREVVHALNKKEAPVEGLQTMSFPWTRKPNGTEDEVNSDVPHHRQASVSIAHPDD